MAVGMARRRAERAGGGNQQQEEESNSRIHGSGGFCVEYEATGPVDAEHLPKGGAH
jgi:hypothetical protein